MKTETMFVWQVKLDGRIVEVLAADKLRASKQAARALGVEWRRTAGRMDILLLRKAGKREVERWEKQQSGGGRPQGSLLR